MQAISLKAQLREVTGKKVRKLRKEGLLPVGVYGKDVKSVALSVGTSDFMKVYEKAGETGLVELKYDSTTLPVLIANVQIHSVTRLPLHAEMHAVKLTEKIKANVPVELLGESPAVASGAGVLLQTLSEVEVEALPAELPEKIEVDVTTLTEIGLAVTVGQLKIPKGVEVLSPAEEVVVKVASAVSEETKKELEAEEAAKVAAAEASATPVEGAPAAEGQAAAQGSGEAKEAKTEEAPKEEKKG